MLARGSRTYGPTYMLARQSQTYGPTYMLARKSQTYGPPYMLARGSRTYGPPYMLARGSRTWFHFVYRLLDLLRKTENPVISDPSCPWTLLSFVLVSVYMGRISVDHKYESLSDF